MLILCGFWGSILKHNQNKNKIILNCLLLTPTSSKGHFLPWHLLELDYHLSSQSWSTVPPCWHWHWHPRPCARNQKEDHGAWKAQRPHPHASIPTAHRTDPSLLFSQQPWKCIDQITLMRYSALCIKLTYSGKHFPRRVHLKIKEAGCPQVLVEVLIYWSFAFVSHHLSLVI